MSTDVNRTKLIIKKGGSVTVDPTKKPDEVKSAKPVKVKE